MSTHQLCQYQGQAAHRLTLPTGDALLVASQGAQALSWQCAGRERLYLSPANRWDGHTALRGGIPVCFPQFNQRGPLVKHGFARNLPWHLKGVALSADSARLTLQRQSDAHTLAVWPHPFSAELTLQLSPLQLHLALTVHNTGDHAWSFSGALHTYLAVDAVQALGLQGLGGQAEWDALRDTTTPAAAQLRCAGEFDRVYDASAQSLLLQDGRHRLQISQSPSWTHTVVWNPGPDKVLPDMPQGDYARMLCVEAAQVFTPICLDPAQCWQGTQTLQVLA